MEVQVEVIRIAQVVQLLRPVQADSATVLCGQGQRENKRILLSSVYVLSLSGPDELFGLVRKCGNMAGAFTLVLQEREVILQEWRQAA